MKCSEKTYSIGDASRITGVSQKQLRHWEGRYISVPQKSICGEVAYRRYSLSDIALISRIRELMDEGFTLHAASQKASREFK